MHETLDPDFSSNLQEREGTYDIGFNRGCRLVNAAIHTLRLPTRRRRRYLL